MNDSKNLKNDDQLLSMMEEMQDQIEKLQVDIQAEIDKNSEAQKKISKLSSEKSTLKNEVQKKSEIIVSQNERIEKLSESDLVLKQNEELQRKNMELEKSEKKAREEAESTVEAVKRKAKENVEAVQSKYEERAISLSQREKNISNREILVLARESDIDAEVSIKAELMIRDQVMELGHKLNNKIEKLENEYRDKTEAAVTKYNNMKIVYRGMLVFTLFYSIITTIITVCKTNALITDFIAFVSAIRNGIMVAGGWISTIATFVARLGDMIPQEVVAVIVHWILVAIIYVLIYGGIGWVIFIFGRKYIRFFKDKQTDR